MKKVFFAAVAILLVGYLAFGCVFVQKKASDPSPSRETNVNSGQELGKAMADMEQKALEDKKKIQAKVRAGALTKEDLAGQIEENIRALQANLKNMEDDGPYVEMIGQSAFLLSFSHVPDSSRTPLQKQIEKHAVSVQAEQAHTYLVDRAVKLKRQKEIQQGLKELGEKEISEFTELVWQDMKKGA